MVRSLTSLEQFAQAAWPGADQVAGRFAVASHPNPASQEAYEGAMERLGFGVEFTDHMARGSWTPEQGWHGMRIEPYGPLSLDPAGAVLHYGQEVFEGLKAYRHADGSVWTFRPAYNAARLNVSNNRLMIPEFPVEDFWGPWRDWFVLMSVGFRARLAQRCICVRLFLRLRRFGGACRASV